MRACIRACLRARIRACVRAYVRAYVRACVCARARAYVRACVYVRARARMATVVVVRDESEPSFAFGDGGARPSAPAVGSRRWLEADVLRLRAILSHPARVWVEGGCPLRHRGAGTNHRDRRGGSESSGAGGARAAPRARAGVAEEAPVGVERGRIRRDLHARPVSGARRARVV